MDQNEARPADARAGTVPGEWPASRVAWRLVIILTFIYGIAFVHRVGMSLLVGPIQADLQFSDTQIGLLTGMLFAVPYMLGGPLFGWLVDQYNRRALVIATGALWSAATAATGLFTSFIGMAFARITLGLSQSALQPASASLIADCFPAGERSRAYGVYVTATAFGTAGAYWIGALAIGIGQVLSESFGIRDWTGAFLALGVAGLLAPLAMAFAVEPVRRERAVTGAVGVRETARFMRREKLVVSTLCIGIAVVFLAPYGQLAFMPVMFERRYGWSPAELATAFGAIAVVAGGLGSVTAGWVSAKLASRGRPDSDWTVCLVGAACTLVPGVAAPLMPNGALSLLMFGLSGLFANWPSVGALGVVARLGPNEIRGKITAIYTSSVGLIGAGFGPVVVGTLSDRLPAETGGVAMALSLTFALSAVGGVALLAAGRRRYGELTRNTPVPAPAG